MSDLDLMIETEDLEDDAEAAEVTFDQETGPDEAEIPEILSLLPLRDSVVYPMLIAPLSVGRPSSITLLNENMTAPDRIIGVITQREASLDEPGFNDVYDVGCAVIVRSLMRGPDAVRMIVQGAARFRIVERIQTEPFLKARVEVIRDAPEPALAEEEVEALMRSAAGLFEQAVRLSPNLPDELRGLTQNLETPGMAADLMAAHMPLGVQQKQEILEQMSVRSRLRLLVSMLGREVRVLELSSKVQNEVNAELSKTQRDYYLREQLKAIQRELGEDDGLDQDIRDFREKLEATELPLEARKAVAKEIDRLERINPGSPEYTVARTYVETVLALPWSTSTEDRLDLDEVRRVLDADHAGLETIKDRIIEFMAVRKLRKGQALRQPILCLYGPPGVGKTSLGRSIARAMGRQFVRLSLGGVRDEAEIRGHRRTYIGSMPGQIIQSIRRAETNNPLFVLDEIDKLGSDFRGDPASAMLEVLDPEQNSAFRDHYLDVPFDLSQCFFITTANRLDTIPAPLRDRMEIIELGGYTEAEKLRIAEEHLLPEQIREHGLTPGRLKATPEGLMELVRHYTREAGVRGLNREIATVCRKAALLFAKGRKAAVKLNPKFVHSALGSRRYQHDEVAERKLIPGVSVGLAWTPVGGDVLFVEAVKMPGKSGGLIVTGQLGDVMKESARAAMSLVRSRASEFGIPDGAMEDCEIHIHVPQGSVPKDGPSAGITMVTALVSLLRGQPMRRRMAMTGEVTLTGQVLPIGGVKEKVLAAHRAGVTELILPEENRKDMMEDVPEDIRQQLTVHFAKEIRQVIAAAMKKD